MPMYWYPASLSRVIASSMISSFSCGAGSSTDVDAALRLEALRQMRIVVQRDALGTQYQHFVERGGKRSPRLTRKPIDQIQIDGPEARIAGRFDRLLRYFETLHAVDGFLHVRVEILYADRDTVKAKLSRSTRTLSGRSSARVHFDSNLGVRR